MRGEQSRIQTEGNRQGYAGHNGERFQATTGRKRGGGYGFNLVPGVWGKCFRSIIHLYPMRLSIEGFADDCANEHKGVSQMEGVLQQW